MTASQKIDLPTHIQERIRDGSIHPQAGEYFAPCTSQDIMAFVSTFKNLRLSAQTQREFAEWITEISSRDSIGITELLGNPEITGILQSTPFNPPQIISRIREILFRLRFPVYAATLEQWTVLARRVNPDPKNVVLSPSPGFEKNRLEVKITLSSGEQAKSLFSALAALPQETWDQLIHPQC